KRDGAMFHLPSRIALRMDIRDLFQLECALESNRIVDAPAKIQKIRIAGQLPRQHFNLTFKLQGLFDPVRQMHQVGEEFLRLSLAQASPAPPQRDGQEVERRKLS